MFEPLPFTEPGRWIRAGFHCHTLESDGGLSPAETVARYRRRGYQCLGLTDHRLVTPTAPFTDGSFLGIDATENGGDPDVIGVGVARPAPAEWSLRERCRALAEQGGFTIAAHPHYCAVQPQDYVECPELMALEILNAYCDEAYANGVAVELWDMLLGLGKRIWGVAGDDAHLNPKKRYYSDAGRGWVEIWTASLSQEAVLSALKRGAFYSTQGPRFRSIALDEQGVRIDCTPVREVRWRTHGSVGFVEHASEAGPLTTSRLPAWFKAKRYVRIELVDHQGRRAWSNPVFQER
ncbi:MAG: CehA/McbA family metallohydrolase [Chloroflexi bacterium]|nr:CehA/McbA family metallohydrolase [Chloroflexota bacterium]